MRSWRYGVCQKAKKEKQGQAKSRQQAEIERLERARRELKKQWKQSDDEQRKGISVLQAEVKSTLAMLRRAELLRQRKQKKEQARAAFYKDPFIHW